MSKLRTRETRHGDLQLREMQRAVLHRRLRNGRSSLPTLQREYEQRFVLGQSKLVMKPADVNEPRA